MIVFANAKINIGLNIVNKRNDGFHNIETIIYPIPLYDVIEFNSSKIFSLKIIEQSNPILVNTKNNILFKTWEILHKDYKIPEINIILLKNIPSRSGLGGASSDAVSLLKALNKYFNLQLSENTLYSYAKKLCSDCPFFIKNKPSIVKAKGEDIINISNFLKNKYLVLIKPDLDIDTKTAFSKITVIKNKQIDIINLIDNDIGVWAKHFTNDFYSYNIKNKESYEIVNFLKKNNAEYISVSGTGSSIYGIFSKNPLSINNYKNYFTFKCKLS